MARGDWDMHGGAGRWGRRRRAAPISQAGSSRARFRDFADFFYRRRPHPDEERPDAGDDRPDRETRRRYLRQYAAWLKPHVGIMVGVLLLALVGVAANALRPIFVQQIIDRSLLAEDATFSDRAVLLNLFGLSIIVVSLLGAGVHALQSFRVAVLSAKLQFQLRQQLFDHILRLPLARLSEMKVGGIVSRLSGDIDATTGLVQMALLSPLMASVQAIVALSIVFTVNWQLATAMIAIVPPLMGLHLLYIRRIRPIYRSMRDDRGAVDARVTETFGGIRVVRAFRREPHEEHDYAVGHHTVIRKHLFAQLRQIGVGSGWELMFPAVTVVLYWYGGYLVIQGEASVGQLVMFQGYVFQVIGPIMRITSSMTQTQRALASMERVFDALEEPVDKPDLPEAVDAPTPVERIRFEHVWFAYNEGQPVIKDFDLTVEGGQVVALVGPSGAGKTTITDLVARFYDPTQGRILLNGVDLRQIKLHTYRNLLAVVQQDVFLFDGSVRENISYGRRHVSEAELLEAAERANARQFIEELPEGFDTVIGERGVKLSGGQRQRLSIARAVLADPQILILDEATSNLDTESEQLIQSALADLYVNRTTFVIAHRLSTVTHADILVVMRDGHIIEVGTHGELMDRRGEYHEMVERQASFAFTGGLGG